MTVSNSYFVNNTNHYIKVQAFENDIITYASSFSLNNDTTLLVFQTINGGISDGVSFGYINQPLDSIVVTFDSLYSTTHYSWRLTGPNQKCYLFNSKRNIFNDSSYVVTLVNDSKYRHERNFVYTFTEQDYLDAAR